MASTTISYLKVNDLKPYFEEAAKGSENSATALLVLSESLNTCDKNVKAYKWANYTRNEWLGAMENVFQKVVPGAALTTEQRTLLQAMLRVGLDSELLRKHYRYLLQEELSACSNLDNILSDLGFYKPETEKKIYEVVAGLRVYRAIVPGATFWDKLNGLNKISNFNDSTRIISYEQDGKEKTAKLAAFTKNETLIVPGSVMEKLINKVGGLAYSSEEELLADAKNGIVLYQEGSELSKVKEILIPEIYSQEEFKALCTVAVQTSSRWDASRSLQELENRLEEEAVLVGKFQKSVLDALEGMKKFVTNVTKKGKTDFGVAISENAREALNIIDRNEKVLAELESTEAVVEVRKAKKILASMRELLTSPQAINVQKDENAPLPNTKVLLGLLSASNATSNQVVEGSEGEKATGVETTKALLDNAKKECLNELESLKQGVLSVGSFLDTSSAEWESKNGGANVKGILEKEANRLKNEYLSPSYSDSFDRSDRTKRAVCWANTVSMLCKTPKCCEMVTNFLKDSLAKAAQETVEGDQKKDSDIIRRKCLLALAEVTDALPGKQVPEWMQLVKVLAGEDFLIDVTLLMPLRLWAHTEKLLASKEEKKHFQDRIFEDFKHGKPTADHYAWLWKNRKSASLVKDYQDSIIRFLGDSDLLFKTLHRDLKGNYLKSQREIRHLLIDDEEFKKWVMKQGERTAVNNLVRCVNRLPLLDTSEKQSVLVKIVRIYPEALGIVEESAATKKERERISSIHSMLRLQQELDKLVNELIPANTAALKDARSLGDLSENSEFKFAKEQQRMLNQKRGDLERSLRDCKFIDFENLDFDGIVAPGTVVTLHLENQTEQVITLLGLFDSDDEREWFSYDSPLGRILCDHKVGDRIVTSAGDRATIVKIEKLSEEVLELLRK